MKAAADTSETAARFAESITVLPPLPVTAQKILTCFGDEFIDADKVAEVVEGDAGICAKLLGLTNSAYFGLAEPLYQISEAISRVLGVDTVRSLVLAMAIQQSFNSKECPSFSAERFWVDSLMVAELCKKIAAIDSDADDVGSGLFKNLYLPGRGIDIHSPSGGHTLYGYRRITPNSQGADTDFSGFARLDWGIHSWILSLKGWCRIDK